jgi:MFS family permease
MVPAGATLGSLLAGTISYYGRRTCIYVANVFVILGCSICIIPYPPALIVGRLIYGLAVGIFSVIIPIFIIEISPIQLKGSYGGVSQLSITTGIMISYLMGILGRNQNGDNSSNSKITWIIVLIFGFPILLATIQVLAITFLFKYESPKYYIIKDNTAKAKEVAGIIYMRYSKTLNNTSESQGLTFEASNFDPNPDGRTFRSLKRLKYRRAFLVG